MEETVLLVDDEENARTALSIALGKDGYRVLGASSGEEGKDLLDNNPVDILITDMKMPGVSGMDLLNYAKRHHPDVVVIMITGHATIESAITAMKEGAFDYITKPIKLDEVRITIQKACEKRSLLVENLLLKQQLKKKYRFENIIGASPSMQDVFSMMEKVIGTDSTVLINGDSGTGKELVAKAIHYNSPRKDKPFVAINCEAIPADLLESELFGHVRGAFTGAVASRPGRFELANKGTIFLDEIGGMSPFLQGKLLRVLQEKEIERVGGGVTTKVDVRIIAATNVDLLKAVKKGEFRDDLFYRLNVIPINLPPLRERIEDIPLLTGHFVKKYAEKAQKNIKGVAAGVMDHLTAYDWPGNIRELENVIERAVALSEGRYIEVDALPAAITHATGETMSKITPYVPDKGTDLDKEMQRFEKMLIGIALEKSGGVKSKAAELLNIKRTTLIEKLKRLGPLD